MSQELIELENRLTAAAFPPPPEFRDQILRRISSELTAPPPRNIRPASGWPWAAIAAAAVVALGLSMVDSSRQEFARRPQQSSGGAMAEIHALEQVRILEPGGFQ